MTGFERAAVALIYNLYHSRKAHKEPIVNRFFTIATYNDNQELKVERIFKVRTVSGTSFDLVWEERNKYRVYNSTHITKDSTIILTEERPYERLEIERLDSTRAEGIAAKYYFTLEPYSYDTVKAYDKEHNRTYTYKITG